MDKESRQDDIDHYGAQYGNFDNEVVAKVRQEAFGEDIGQTGWLTTREQDLFIGRLQLGPEQHLLDVACGSAQPTLRIAEKTGCHITGVDIDDRAISNAINAAKKRGLEARCRFRTVANDGSLSDDDATYDAVTCIDAINHLLSRASVLNEWRRVLKPKGRILFTDPIVITGPISFDELRIRFAIGDFLLVPSGIDEKMLAQAGFDVEWMEDRTENMARNARGWLEARARYETDLRRIEGNKTFEDQQKFFEVAATLAEERRLSRFAFQAIRH